MSFEMTSRLLVMLCLVSLVTAAEAPVKEDEAHYQDIKGDTELEDFYGSEDEDSDDEFTTTTSTTTPRPELMLEGWHFAMFAVGSSLVLIFIGGGIGACLEIRRLRKADRLYCGCFDDRC